MLLDELHGRRVFVSDYDGTITRHDFFLRVLDRYPEARRHWDDFLEHRISHFESLRRIFAHPSGGRDELLELAHETEIEPQLGVWIGRLQEAGWKIIVVSAGCDWYIRTLFRAQNVDLPIIGNPGDVSDAGRLEMRLPDSNEFYYSAEIGIDKKKIIECVSEVASVVAFAGDGRPDLAAARLVPEELRFAREWLAESLDKEQLPYRPFERWSEVAQALLGTSAAGR